MCKCNAFLLNVPDELKTTVTGRMNASGARGGGKLINIKVSIVQKKKM